MIHKLGLSTLAVLITLSCSTTPKTQRSFHSNSLRPAPDWRNIRNGQTVPDQGYCDQPYVVVANDGNWLCTLTTGKGKEGDLGQHVVATISEDRGKTWSELIDIEPETGPEASWVIPLATPYGRIYAFYDYNGDRVSGRRADMLGWYVYKYSDDGGRTWSKQRYRLPVRRTACDADNGLDDGTQIFWGIDKPMIQDGSVYFGFTKLGKYMLDLGEGWVFRSDNILTERDPEKIEWVMLPEGDKGIRNEAFGSIQEEHNLVALDDGSLFCMYRTTTGHPCQSYSRDGGRTWSEPEYATYSPDGRFFKHNRACPTVWKTKEGNYLFWFNNLGDNTFNQRNPIWISGGVEKNGFIHWSQPEVLLYDPDRGIRISYPDLIEENGRYWISQTQKSVARISEIDPTLLEGLWRQNKSKRVAKNGLVLDLNSRNLRHYDSRNDSRNDLTVTSLPRIADGGGFSFDFWIQLDSLKPGQVLINTRNEKGKGILIQTAANGSIRTTLNDGSQEFSWDSDANSLTSNGKHHVAVIVDGGPKILSYVIDGVLCDGGDERPQGWGRLPKDLVDVNGSNQLRVGKPVRRLRVYDRYLRTSEAVAAYRAEK